MAKQMKIIMYIMPIMFMGFLNSYSSGLTYYYFTANMITFFQLERKEKLPDDVTAEVFAVKNIKFIFKKGSSKLIILDESKEELNKLIDYMKRVESFKIEVFGHTDNSGSPDYNIKLSRERAQVVGDYFVQHGINKERTIVQGFGSDKPVADNETEEGRTKNRRVEVQIVE